MFEHKIVDNAVVDHFRHNGRYAEFHQNESTGRKDVNSKKQFVIFQIVQYQFQIFTILSKKERCDASFMIDYKVTL